MEKDLTVQFDFTPAGVVQYNAWLSGLSEHDRQAEAMLAISGLGEFLETRFVLTEEQLEYAENLEEGIAYLWARQIAYAIDYQLPLELVKPEQSIRASTKYIRSESNTSAGEPAPTARTGDFLRFVITEHGDSA
ncbi:hypothetical protein [Parapedobacter soli]|uniref:hypothetical protein n=1 Tax=Parapedobacter soli TaxID=416955 RepID=UPI0021C6A375|nr:hypothetical protein [Parapedobacter soli]